MKKEFLSFVVLLTICCIPMLAVTAATFPYALESTDVGTGFELVSTSADTETTITQAWKTPSDNTGATSLSVVKHDKAEDVDAAFATLEAAGYTSVTVEGADKAVKLTLSVGTVSQTSIAANKGDYFASGQTGGTEADLITLLEAQMDKLPGAGGAPGFVLITAIFAIGTTGILLKKARR